MSLLLDARKKSQESQGGSGLELSLETVQPSSRRTHEIPPPPTHDDIRQAGQNLFNAKTASSPATARASINRNLLIALGATFALLAAGAAYVWYEISPKSARVVQPVAPLSTATQPSTAVAMPPASTPAAITVQSGTTVSPPAKRKGTRRQKAEPVHIEQTPSEPIDPILNDAYRAYQAGQLDQAQQLYQQALRLDSRNTDALLGLAAIAQFRGSDYVAVHYYLKVLELDPRDPVANAGMSALSTSENVESRLKTLLNEQPNSSALHSALGNRYAEQERWAEAQQSYFNAYRLEPKNASLAFNLGVSLDRIGQYKLAAEYYQRALALDTNHSAGIDHAKVALRIEELAP